MIVREKERITENDLSASFLSSGVPSARLRFDPLQEVSLLSKRGFSEFIRFESAALAASACENFIAGEEGVGSWVAVTKSDSDKYIQAGGKSFQMARSAIHLPTRDRHGATVPEHLLAQIREEAAALGLGTVSSAVGCWRLSNTGQQITEPILIVSSHDSINETALRALANKIVITTNQDALAFEYGGELIQVFPESRVLLTGASGDLGTALKSDMTATGGLAFSFDINPPAVSRGVFIKGSILEIDSMAQALAHADTLVHIAALHGIHEFRKEATPEEFWNINVNGTRAVLEAALRASVKNIVILSSTSAIEQQGYYGLTKHIADEVVRSYATKYNLNVIILRPRAFIPPWNTRVYKNYEDWLKYFSQGGVHIEDVARAVKLSIAYLKSNKGTLETLIIDGKHENQEERRRAFSSNEEAGFFEDTVVRLGLPLEAKRYDCSAAKNIIGYEPNIGLREAVAGLRAVT